LKILHNNNIENFIMEALIFDCDGVLVDTERDGHRVAFNMAFAHYGINVEWSIEEYKRLLKIAGGKERMKYFFDETKWPSQFENQEQLILELHKQKTSFFMQLIESGTLPLRSGIKRLVDEAISHNLKMAVCSTSNEKSVRLIVELLLGKERANNFHAILAGDMVSRKKPDPEIYNLCINRLNINPKNCVVVEDSRNGLIAAKAAHFNCLITTNGYTVDEDFGEADMLIDELGDEPNIKVTINELIQLVKNKNK
jgi:HAD superfamily hydrolase (TIGR01509 family)